MFHAAFQSLSEANPHDGHECSRTHNGLSVETPQAAHSLVVPAGSTATKCVPSRSHLYSSIRSDLAAKTRAVERAVARLESTHSDVDVDCSLPDRSFARVDEYLQTAIFQVLENAVEHTDRPRPSIDVTLSDCPEDDILTLSIADDGPGIPDDERDLLEGDREITQLRHANGLGLWLVNWIVTRTGGQFSVTDNDPRGTVVTLEVPRADAKSVTAASDRTATGD